MLLGGAKQRPSSVYAFSNPVYRPASPFAASGRTHWFRRGRGHDAPRRARGLKQEVFALLVVALISAVVVATQCRRLCLWVVASDPCKDSRVGFIGMKELCIAEGLRFSTKMTGVM